MKKVIALSITLGLLMIIVACGDGTQSNSSTPVDPNDNPTEAYKRLYTAVKANDPAAIKNAVSEKTHGLAESLAARQKKTVEEVYKNGFTATTFAESLPEIRDQRIKDNMGAVEVWNSKDSKWEDLPFIREASGWKLAIGDVFANTYKSPGRGRDMIEREAANAISGNQMAPVPMPMNGSNPNANSKSAVNAAKPAAAPPANK